MKSSVARRIKEYPHPLQSQAVNPLGQPASRVAGFKADVGDIQTLLIDFNHHLPRQLRLLTIILGPTALLWPPEPKGDWDTPNTHTPEQDDYAESAHLALLGGRVGPAHPGVMRG